jgi:hypothetical protein
MAQVLQAPELAHLGDSHGLTVCLYEDPISRRQLPRNYVENLERRLDYVETLLRQQQLVYQPQPEPGLQASSITTSSPEPRTLADYETTEDLHDLASKVGTLSLNAAGAEPHYLGSSSTFAFARLIKPLLSQVGNSTFQDEPSEAVDLTTPATCHLPDPATAVILSNAYFDNIHSQYPFLYEADFREWESAIILHAHEPIIDSAPYFFLNIVCLYTRH